MRLEQLKHAERTHTGDSVAAWLRVLRNLLNLPEAQASSICEELEMHLRERIRDLQVSGMDESDAIRTAIGELGDAAVLAGRYRSATRSKYRRLTMNIAVAIVAGTAAILSVVAVSRAPYAAQPLAEAEQQGTGDVQSPLDAAQVYLNLVPVLEGSEIELVLRPTLQALTFDEAPAPGADAKFSELSLDEIPLGQLLDRLAHRLGAPLRVKWSRLEDFVTPDTQVLIIGEDLDLPAVFKQINDDLSDFTILDYRFEGGVLEVAARSDLDRRELRLVTYDVGPVLTAGRERFNQSRDDVLRELLTTLHQFASPYDWAENGGELASHTVVGDRLFVEAPPRMHRQISWILEQLVAAAAGPDGRASTAGDAQVLKRYVLSHVDAATALVMLRNSEAISAIDLSRFTLDPRTNSILGIASRADHQVVSGTLAVLDRSGK